MGIIPALCFLLFCTNILAKEDCDKACSGRFNDNSKIQGCKDGCHLAIVYTILLPDPQNVQKKCEEGCAKTYGKIAEIEEACKFGCQNQQGRESGEVTLTEKDAIVRVVQKELKETMIPSPIGSMPYFRFMPPFEKTMNKMRAFHEMMMRMSERNQFSIPQLSFVDGDDIAKHRPHGHLSDSFKGPEVDNKDNNGEEILHVKPIKHRRIFLSVYADPYHYNVARIQKPVDEASFVERLSQGARRMSILSQWLICIALLLCLLSMMGISLAIIRQIKLQQRLRARQSHVVIPAIHEQPLPAKKVPLESPATTIDYPLIHDTPPPAYDQLSVQKVKLQDP